MVTEALTEQMQAEGGRLTKALHSSHLRATTTLWFYFEEVHRWRFVFASALVERVGPKEVYREVQQIIKKLKPPLSTIDLTDVVVLPAKHPLIRLMREAAGSHVGSAVRLSRDTVNGQFVEDAFIYRTTKAV